MPGFIRTIIAATLIQILVVVGLVVYMSGHDLDIARQYAVMAEHNAKAYTDQRNLDLYNRIQQDQSRNRADLELWLSRQIDLRLLKENK